MIHIYCGDGKGKTTAAMGLALRAAGRGERVVIAQFLKSADSGERTSLARLPNVTLLDAPAEMKFVFQMTEEERAAEARRQTGLLREAEEEARGGAGLLELDELCAAVSTGMTPLTGVLALLDSLPAGLEVAITGREPARELLDGADYITEMRKLRHPYDRGQGPRLGVEW